MRFGVRKVPNQSRTELTHPAPCSPCAQERAPASAQGAEHWAHDFKHTLRASLNLKSRAQQPASSVPPWALGDSGISRSTVEKFCPWTSARQPPLEVFQAVMWADLRVRFSPVYKADNLGCLC